MITYNLFSLIELDCGETPGDLRTESEKTKSALKSRRNRKELRKVLTKKITQEKVTQEKISSKQHTSKRIIGGKRTNGTWSWQVLLYYPSGASLCGGAILSKHFILTASHCFCKKYFLRILKFPDSLCWKDNSVS